jgi:hypothetical protein
VPSNPQSATSPAGGKSRWVIVALWMWGAAISAGFCGLWSYASTPGESAAAPVNWPESSVWKRTPGRWTLLMFVHPRCPCTQASIAELERLQAQAAGQIDIRIALFQPGTESPAWDQTSLTRRAAALPAAVVAVDPDGSEARRFHAQTSGETLLYDPAGRLAYHGGITAARGHEGDNPGSDAILALLAGRTAPTSCPAFGCPLFRSQPSAREPAP